MGVKLGPAGVPLSCKGRTIVEGMDDIIALGLETMEAQTVRLIQPQHFEQYWQVGVLANKADFEMNIHGPYYSELLGNRVERGRSLAKIEATLQTAQPSTHVTSRFTQVTTETSDVALLPTNRLPTSSPALLSVSTTSGMTTRMSFQSSLGSMMVHHPRSVSRHRVVKNCGEASKKSSKLSTTLKEPSLVLNIVYIHARGHGRMKTSEDYGELFDMVRESIGTKEFYCHFSGVEHRTGNAMHYTQIKKSDLNFEPLAEFIVEDGGWLDITLISDSPLLEHDAMYMLQNIDKSKHKQLERKAREDRRRALAAQTGTSVEDLQRREEEMAKLRTQGGKAEPVEEAKPEPEPVKEDKKPKKKAAASKKKKKMSSPSTRKTMTTCSDSVNQILSKIVPFSLS